MYPSIQKDFQRQVEILAFCLNNESFSKVDFANKFDVAEITINRDLSSLRKMGIQIYSKNGKVVVEDVPSTNLLILLASNYLSIQSNLSELNKKITSFSKLGKESFLNKLILLSKAVTDHKIIVIKYKRFSDNKIKSYKIKPINLFANELNWILSAYDYNSANPKTFFLSRIKLIKLTSESFTETKSEVSKDLFYKIKLRFNPKVKEQIYDKIWFTEFDMEEDSDGYVILNTKQQISNKLSSWCISWWDMIEVLEPKELKHEIKEMIKAFQKNQ